MRSWLQTAIAALNRLARRLARDEDGNVIIYVTLTAGVLLGMVGLALDSSRAVITHSEAQAAADAAALAGASQLDGSSSACDNAKTMAANVTNQQRFATSGPAAVAIASGSPVCLTDLPGSDSASVSSFATTDGPSSRYVEVTTEQLTHANTLLAALASSNTATIQGKAVAGFRRSLCAAAPVEMVCSTFNWTAGVAFDAWASDASLKGWVSECGNSAPCVETTLASTQPPFCVVDSSVQPVPGNKTNKAETGINTRFGIGSSSTEPSDQDVIAYPHDTVQGTLGWNCAAYWAANHASDGLAQPAGCTSNATTLRRYDVYQLERAGPTQHIPAAGVPGVSSSAITTTERRLVYLAIFNCDNPTVPLGFIKAFMIEPASGASVFTQFVEPLGFSTSKTDPNAVHEEVMLYR